MKNTNSPFLLSKSLAVFLLMFLFVFSATAQQQQVFEYNDTWGDAGYNLVSSKSSGATVIHSLQNVALQEINIKGEQMMNVMAPGYILPNDEGAPNLPGNGRYIAIPEGATASVEVVNFRTEIISDVKIAPAPRIPLDTETAPLEYNKDSKIYGNNAFYPAKPVQLSEVTQIRGVDVVMLGITPFQYNPVTEELIIYRDIEVNVTFEGGTSTFGEERFRSYWWDNILQDALLNADMLPEMDYSSRYTQGAKDDGCDYLIITPNGQDFVDWANTLRDFRQLQGIETKIVTLDEVGGNNPTTIENYINNIAATWDPVPTAVLLLGDYGSSADNSVTSPIYNGYCVSDHIYSDLNGNHMPDIIFARMTAQNAGHLETMVNKVINYESNPPTNQHFYDHPVTAMGWQTERWFQICSETVNGFWEYELGKSPVRENALYSGSPAGQWSSNQNTSMVVNYFGPNGLGYIPATPNHLTDWGGNATRLNNDINNGAFMIQHRDHGGETLWGEPAYNISNINQLNNDDLTFVFSINCLTGKYNISGTCFTEAFHRHEKGALGLIAASETSYSFVNDTYVWGLYDEMWPDFMPDYGAPSTANDWVYPAFGNAAGKIFLEQSNWPYNTDNKEVTYYLFHHHGDAFTTVYTEMPQDLTIVHDAALLSGLTTFDVTADEGAVIALTVGGEIIGKGIGLGSAPTTINIESQLPGGDPVVVTVTKQDYFRYSEAIDVIPPDGAYVVKSDYSLNDAAGNNNGMADFGEDILLTLEVKNVGTDPANNVDVTISTSDANITITDDTEAYGTIASGATATVADGFAFTVANDVQDEHIATFNVDATDGTDTWTTSFNVTLNAPVLDLGGLSVADAAGNNNNRLDPGEVADINIDAFNFGHALAPDAEVSLSCTNTYVTFTNTTDEVGDIDVESSQQATFEVTVDEDAPIGELVEMEFTVTSGQYTYTWATGLKIGLIIEDFETNSFNAYPWMMDGDAPWTTATDQVYEGTYSAKSGAITDNQESVMELELNVLNDDEISFYYKVSSENNYDYLQFYIDGQMQDEWSGDVDWTEAVYSVEPGVHSFKWVYMKDFTVSGGQDCAWVDYLVLPAFSAVDYPPVFVSSPVTEVREGTLYEYEIETYDMNGLDNLVVEAVDIPAWLTFTDNGNGMATLEGTPDNSAVGTVAVELSVADGANDPVSQEFNLEVTANNAPGFNTPPLTTATENEVYTYNIAASDDDGDDITFDTPTIPAWLSFTDNGDGTAVLEGTPASGNVGENEVVVTITDGIVPEPTDQSFTITVSEYVSIADLEAGYSVQIFPNPNNGQFQIEMQNESDSGLTIQIVSTSGQVVFNKTCDKNQNTEEVDLSHVSAGVYFVKVITENSVKVEKIIIR